MACELIAKASAGSGGVLLSEGMELTSERVRAAVNHYLVDQGFNGPQFIIAGGAHGAIGHHIGEGPLRTGQPVIVDIYPTDRSTHYCGDCTRTVVHGEIPDEIAQMHRTVGHDGNRRSQPSAELCAGPRGSRTGGGVRPRLGSA